MTVVKLPSMSRDEIEKLIQEQILCRIAFRGQAYPYVAPFQYVFQNGSLYFHFTNYGRKMRSLKRNEPVCVEVENYKPDLSEYSFVVLKGSLSIVEDPQEKANVIKKMQQDGKRRLSESFLAAHGFDKEEGWSILSRNRDITIVKLEGITERMGLKSPK